MADETTGASSSEDSPSSDERIYDLLRRIGLCLNTTVDRSDLNLGDIPQATRDADELAVMQAGAQQVGILIKETRVRAQEVTSFLNEGFPVVIAENNGVIWLLERPSGRRIEASQIGQTVSYEMLKRSRVQDLLDNPNNRAFVAKRELECAALSVDQAHDHDHDSDHHASPLRRFISMLRLDQRDIWTLVLFALVAGILSLATPLAIESLVNVVSWGTYIQPLLVLAFMLLACLGLAGVLSILQAVIVEMIQRRQLVRIVGDLAHRFPRAVQESIQGHYPRELANRVFDIMTIQKASATLLLDGVSIVLTTTVGLLLLAFYHPFLLGFDIVLIISMVSITWVLGRGAIQTAIDESIAKYRIAHWLQDMLSMPSAFKVNGGETLGIERANRLTADYLVARQNQFRVIIRQVTFAIGLQVVASTALLGLGGWLVIQQQLTLGQLVASELVVTVVVGAFSKAGKSLEKFYDLMAGIDKVGHLLDIPVDARFELGELPEGPALVRWESLVFSFKKTGSKVQIPAAELKPGTSTAIIGSDSSGKSLLIKTLAGLVNPSQGSAEIAGTEANRAALAGEWRLVGHAGETEIFHSTVEANVDLARGNIGRNQVREALVQVGLWDDIIRLPDGLKTVLQTDGYPLSKSQKSLLMIARAIVGEPRLLLVDGLLDALGPASQVRVWDAIAGKNKPWTLLVASNQREISDRCDQKIDLGK